MNILEISKNGETKEKRLSRVEVVSEMGVHNRDLRPIFSSKQLSTISPRKDVVIVHLGAVKLIITVNKALFFATGERKRRDFVDSFLRKNNREGHFPLLMLEHAFAFALDKIRDEFQKNHRDTQRLLQKMRNTLSDHFFEMLLTNKKQLSKIATLVREIEEAAEEILRDEKDLHDICLGQKNTSEAENVLEHAWEQFEDLSHQIAELGENIDDTQEIITLKMANRRNVIIKFDLVVTLITAVLSALAVVVGLFGMNLKNHFEANEMAFTVISVSIVLFFLMAIIFSVVLMKKKKIW